MLNLHLIFLVQNQENKHLANKLLKSLIRLINYCETNCEELAKSGELKGLIQNKLFGLIINSLDFSIKSDKKFSNQQLYLLEMYIKVGSIR